MPEPSPRKGQPFRWPEGRRAAVSLSFDDARLSQVDCGLPILDAHGAKATFYVSVGNLEHRLAGWRGAVANGHEIGNHTLSHPCSANFPFSRANALEDYTLDRMEAELTGANAAIERLLGVTPATFAYPCGQTFVGRGEAARSYVPLVARRFIAARTAYCEIYNDPAVCDPAQATAFEADGKAFAQLRPLIDRTMEAGGWAIFFGHEVGGGGHQTVLADALDAFCRYAKDPANGLWLDTVAAVGTFVANARLA